MKEEIVENKEMIKKSKKGLIIVLIIVIILALGCTGGYFYVSTNDQKLENSAKKELENSITLEDKTYEYGTEIKVSDFNLKDGQKLYVNDTEITSESFKLDKLGDNQVKITSELTYKDTFKKEHNINTSKIVTYKVEDKTPPEITGNEDKTITVGDTIDIKANVKATDNVDGEVEVKDEGNVDTNTEGQYKIKYIAEDKSGNKTEKENTITVNKKQEEVKTSTNTNTSTNTKSNTKSTTSNSKTTTTTSTKKTSTKKSTTSNKSTKSSSKASAKSNSESTEDSVGYVNGKPGDVYHVETIPGTETYYGYGGKHVSKDDDWGWYSVDGKVTAKNGKPITDGE